MTAPVRARRDPIHRRRVQVLGRLIAGLIPQSARVLDVGSGDGRIGEVLMSLRPDIGVEGIDIAVPPKPRIPTRVFDGTRIPYAGGAFDVVLFVDVLHHTEAPAALLAEAARVAATAVILKDHLSDRCLARPVLRFMDWTANARLGMSLPYNYWPRARWKTAFEKLGLQEENFQTGLGLYPRPFEFLFGGTLHFLARLAVPGAEGDRIPRPEASQGSSA